MGQATGLFTMRGSSGRIRSGCRVVAEFRDWTGTALGGRRRMRVTADKVQRDPVWWSHHTHPLEAALDVGGHVWHGPALIESADPLTFRIEEFDIA